MFVLPIVFYDNATRMLYIIIIKIINVQYFFIIKIYLNKPWLSIEKFFYFFFFF